MRIGIIGLGARMAHLVPLLAASEPAARFVAVADPHETRMGVFDGLGLRPRIHADPAEMLAAHRLDLLLVGSPNHRHLEHLRLALRSDIPRIFVEKPLVISLAQTLDLARLVAAHDGLRRIMVGMVLRYSPLYRLLRRAQADGLVGEIMSIEASEHIAPGHGSFFMRDWRRDSGLSGGFMLEKCCHDLDLYQGVVGQRPARVASFGGRRKFVPAHRPPREPDYLSVMSPRWGGIDDAFSGAGDIVDCQTALVEYGDGSSLAFHTNLNAPDEFRRFCVIGRDGMAEGDFVRNYFRVTLSDSGLSPVDISQVAKDGAGGHYGADGEMTRDIMAYLRGELAMLPLDLVDGLEAGLTALAMDDARKSRRVVELAETWAAFDDALAGGSPQ